MRVAAAAILVFVVARAAYYPFWAASTDSEELARSWGGPSPTAATLAHWAVAALVGSVCVAVVVLSTRLMRPHR